MKDPYQFDFLALASDIKEHELERALVARVKGFLLEMGKGFAFICSSIIGGCAAWWPSI